MLHLFHPALVHFPVALLVLGGLAEAWGLVSRREPVARFGGILVILGTLSLMPTIVTGYLAANSVDLIEAAHPVLDRHEQLGLAALGVFLGALFWKGWEGGAIADGRRRLYAMLLLAGVAVVIYGALLGGKLVYVHGTGVG